LQVANKISEITRRSSTLDVISSGMRMIRDRAVFAVERHDGVWRAECDGEPFGRSRQKEEAKATAHRHGRKMSDQGRACGVHVSGEDASPRDRGEM
jgi:hypothetical protein